MSSEPGQRVIAVLEADGPALPLVVLARKLGIPPTRLVPVLDDLFDAGLVAPGPERGTVALVPRRLDGGRFQRAPAADPARSRS